MKDYNKNDIFWKDFVNLPNNPYKLDTDLNGFNCLLAHFTKEGDYSRFDCPISLGYMASILRMNGANATISIQDIDKYDKSKFSGYDFICIYPTVFLLRPMLEIANKIKKDFSKTKICLFNSEQHQHEMLLCMPNAQNFANIIMRRYPSVDYILIGEAEGSFIRLCNNIFKKEETGLSDIPSCLYREKGKVVFSNKPMVPVDFKYLPFPSRDFLEDSIVDGVNQLSPRVQSNRGCCGGCRYCAESFMNIPANGRKMPILNRDIFIFLDEIEMLYDKYKVRFFNIIDSSFEDPGKIGLDRFRTFFDEVLKRGINASFKIHMRVETISKLDDDSINKIKEAGVDVLIIGIESSIERELKSYKLKKITIENDTNNIIRIDNTGKFYTLTGHMMFSALLRLEDLPRKAAFLRKMNRGWDFALIGRGVLAFKGTAYNDYLRERGLLLESDELSPMAHYRYEDERVKYVSNEMGILKKKCPDIIALQNLLYDSKNIISRYYNKMNKHLWEKEEIFMAFKEEMNKVFLDVQHIYTSYFLDLVELAESSWSDEKANLLYKKWIMQPIPSTLVKARKLIDGLISGYNKQNLSTKTLYLKTWMSLINSQINTSGGKVEQ